MFSDSDNLIIIDSNNKLYRLNKIYSTYIDLHPPVNPLKQNTAFFKLQTRVRVSGFDSQISYYRSADLGQ